MATDIGNSATDRRNIIAQAMLDGCNDAAIRDRLIATGLSPDIADREIERLRHDPLFAAARLLSNRLAKRDWTLAIYQRLSAQDVETLTIPCVDRIDPDHFFRDYYRANRPVKLTGLVDHWPALNNWTYDYLDEMVGDAIVELQGQRSAAADYEMAKDRHMRRAPLRKVTELLRQGIVSNDFYITAYNNRTNNETLAPLWDDLGPVSLLRDTNGRDGFFWMGPKGTLTPFHHDLTNNLLVQVAGRKRVRMVPSWEVARMRNIRHCFSGLEPADFAQGTPGTPPLLECVIDKGEAIFLPVGWWHHVEALDATISMSFTNFAADNDFASNYPKDLDY